MNLWGKEIPNPPIVGIDSPAKETEEYYRDTTGRGPNQSTKLGRMNRQ